MKWKLYLIKTLDSLTAKNILKKRSGIMSTLSSHRRYRVNTTSTVNQKSPNNVFKLLSRHRFRRNHKSSPLVMSQSNWDLTNLKTNDFNVCPTIDRYKQLKWKVFLVNAKLPDGSWRQVCPLSYSPLHWSHALIILAQISWTLIEFLSQMSTKNSKINFSYFESFSPKS